MEPVEPALVVLNPAARGGRGRELWAKLASTIGTFFRTEEIELDLHGRWRKRIGEAARQGVRAFLAAGGDGTVHAVVNALLELPGETPFLIGAVGLGSSNDFHKPFDRLVAGIPVKVDPSVVSPRDVGVVEYRTPQGEKKRRYFVVSAGLGLTAAGNAFFNRGDRLLEWLKARHTPSAIVYAACRMIMGYRNISADVRLSSFRGRIEVTNLSVLKTPYLSGFFRFDTPVAPDDGYLAVNLCEGMSRLGALVTLADLGRGRFAGHRRRRSWRVREFDVATAVPAALEVDGEIFEVTSASFSVLPGRLQVCR